MCEAPLVKPPSTATLKKYGLTAELWLDIVKANGYACPICGRSPPEIGFVIDHEHVRGFKDKKLRKVLFNTPEKRRKTVRSVICANCNLKFLPVGMTAKIARNVLTYLESYEKRKLEYESKFMPSTTLEDIKKESNDQ